MIFPQDTNDGDLEIDGFLERLMGVATDVEFDVLPPMEPDQSQLAEWPGVIEIWYMVQGENVVEIPSSSNVLESVVVPLPAVTAQDKNAIWVLPSSEGQVQMPGTLVVICFPGSPPFSVEFVCRCRDGLFADVVSSSSIVVEFSGKDTKLCTGPDTNTVWNEKDLPVPDPGPMAYEALAELMARPVFIRLFGSRNPLIKAENMTNATTIIRPAQ